MKVIIIILQAILNLVRKRRDLIANRNKIPADIKNAIKAIYDPKKQGMTNYDVIEAYAEDFTGWEYRDYRGVTVKLRLVFPALTKILFLKLPTLTISKVV